ncbi:MAG TPA: ZIP family metal transporter [Gammaproteobacteria bacterium]|nr:ZIP family metal transporter [Gammaproteobacteria bacterium]
MTTFQAIVVFTLLGGVLSALAASVFLLLPEAGRERLLPHLVSFAIGALLGAAFLGLLPHALEGGGLANVHALGGTFVFGIIAFFTLEKAVIWRHCHADACEAHAPHDPRAVAAGRLILIGDGLHNFIDGLLIGAAFLTDFHLGVVTSFAVIAHEIPQEVGDVATLLNSGFSRRQSFLYNMAAGFTGVLGGVVAYFAFATAAPYLPYALMLAASSFVYVAVADLIPGLHRRVDIRGSAAQIALILTGLLLIYATHSIMH